MQPQHLDDLRADRVNGDSELIGSWKIMPMRASANGADAPRLGDVASRYPCHQRRYRAGCCLKQCDRARRRAASSLGAVTLLPDPLSPTRRSVLPFCSVKLTSRAVKFRARRTRPEVFARREVGVTAIDSVAIGIRRVAQAVAEKIEQQDRKHDRQSRPEQQPRRAGDGADILRVLQKHPQLTTGGFRPIPRKDSEVSAMIIAGMARVTIASRCDVIEGGMCRKIDRISLEPSRRAAVTKSSSLRAKKRPRTSRASDVHPSGETIAVTVK